MLYHHGSLPYEVALAQCAQKTRDSYQKLIDRGRTQLPAAIDTLQTVPQDTLVKSELLNLLIDETNHRSLVVKDNHELDWNLHDNAWEQICAKTGFPRMYADKLIDADWGKELIETNVNTIFKNDPRRYLVRAVKGQARGFLSDRYRRLDMRPIMDSVFAIAKELGLVVIGATATELKAEIKFALATVLEPIKDEPILYWISVRTSDFGDSKLEIAIGINRAWCTNDAKLDTMFSQVHLGKKLPDDIEFSQQTYALDTQTIVSATKDVFADAFTENRIALFCEKLKAAADKDAPKNVTDALRHAGLTKPETEAATLLYSIPDIEILPQGDTMWRFSNVISFLGQTATPDRKLELEAIAGDVLKRVNPNKALLDTIVHAA